MGFGLYSVAPVPLTLSQLSVILPTGTIAKVTDYGGSIAISDGVRWRLERLYLSWAGLPPASLVPIGTEASVSDCGGAIAVAGVTGWVFRPITFSGSTKVTVTGTTAKTALASVTIPANILGNNGSIYVDTDFTFTGSTNTKNMYAEYAGVVDLLGGYSVNSAPLVASRRSSKFRVRSKTTVIGVPVWTFDGSTSALSQASVDTSVDRAFTISGKLALSTEKLSLEAYSITIQPAM